MMCRINSRGGAYHSALEVGNNTSLSGHPASRTSVAEKQGDEHSPAVPDPSNGSLIVCPAQWSARVSLDLGVGS
jgi:hypothetical protein